jgi:hypothetical protein
MGVKGVTGDPVFKLQQRAKFETSSFDSTLATTPPPHHQLSTSSHHSTSLLANLSPVLVGSWCPASVKTSPCETLVARESTRQPPCRLTSNTVTVLPPPSCASLSPSMPRPFKLARPLLLPRSSGSASVRFCSFFVGVPFHSNLPSDQLPLVSDVDIDGHSDSDWEMAVDVLDSRIEAPISHAGSELETLLEDWERESQTTGYVRRCLAIVFL